MRGVGPRYWAGNALAHYFIGDGGGSGGGGGGRCGSGGGHGGGSGGGGAPRRSSPKASSVDFFLHTFPTILFQESHFLQ